MLAWLTEMHTDPSPSTPSAIVFRDLQACIVRRQHRAVGHRLTMSVFTEQKHVTVAEYEDVARGDPQLRREGATITPDIMAVPWSVAETDLVGTVPHGLAYCFAHVGAAHLQGTAELARRSASYQLARPSRTESGRDVG